jgi:hypothetical protein
LLEAIQKADTVIEAMGWIRRFRDKITVIKLGGSVMEDDTALRHLLIDIVFMETVGMRPVVVHGGGAAISRAMDAAGLKPHFIKGRRYTDEATLKIDGARKSAEESIRICPRLRYLPTPSPKGWKTARQQSQVPDLLPFRVADPSPGQEWRTGQALSQRCCSKGGPRSVQC